MRTLLHRSLGSRLSVFVVLLTLSWAWTNSMAVSKTWTGGFADWNAAGNWNPSGVPGVEDDVVITQASANVLLAGATTNKSLTIGNTAMLTFTNWDTALTVSGDVTVQSGGIITCAGPFTNNAMTNRVHLVCSNLTVDTGGAINVNGKGYKGGLKQDGHTSEENKGSGPCGGYVAYVGGYTAAGGGHGGLGAYQSTLSSANYDSPSMPIMAGSGGGGDYSYYSGGDGGGAILIEAAGCATINGVVTANGTALASSGAGGAVYIGCKTLRASDGFVSANGGDVTFGGPGGGGRIAISYNLAAQSNEALPSLRLSARPGVYPASSTYEGNCDLGTIWLPDTTLLAMPITNFVGDIRGVTNWSPGSVTVNGNWIRFSEDGISIAVSNDFSIINNAKFELSGSTPTDASGVRRRFSEAAPASLVVNGNLVVTNSSAFHVYSTMTNAAAIDGVIVRVNGDMRVLANSWVYPNSHPTNGGSPIFYAGNLTVDANSGFNADGAGSAGGANPPRWAIGYPGYGPGQATGPACGAGYGGIGGQGNAGGLPGQTYGSSNAPCDAGSGGSSGYNNWYDALGGAGGGLIRLEISWRLDLFGTLTAKGLNGHSAASGAGGSGGGIYIRCMEWNASNAVLSAIGGAGGAGDYQAGGGGGGRIAIWRQNDVSTGWISNLVTGGTSSAPSGDPPAPGGNGTVVMGWRDTSGAAIVLE